MLSDIRGAAKHLARYKGAINGYLKLSDLLLSAIGLSGQDPICFKSSKGDGDGSDSTLPLNRVSDSCLPFKRPSFL